MPLKNDAGGFTFIPWRNPAPSTPTRTCDAAPPRPRTITRDELGRIVPLLANIGARVEALEAMRNAAMQQQLQPRSAEQQQQPMRAMQPPMRQQQTEQPNHRQRAQDHACACQQHPLTPRRGDTHDGVNVMLRNPALAPRAHVTFDPTSRQTRDQQQQNFGEKPSRFESAEADRMARHIVGVGPPTAKEMNDAARKFCARDDDKGKLGASGTNVRGNMNEAVSSDPSERFIGSDVFGQFRNDTVRPSPAALSALNSAVSKAKTPMARDAIEDSWSDYMRGSPPDARGDNPWKPKQPIVHDAPWTALAEANNPPTPTSWPLAKNLQCHRAKSTQFALERR
jgi:hypothetical protein